MDRCWNGQVLEWTGPGMDRPWNGQVLEWTGPGMDRCWNGQVLEWTGAAQGLEVEPGPVSDPFGGDGMDVALTQDQVVLALHLDLEAVLRVEQHLIAGLDGAHVGARRYDFCPGETARDLGRRRYQDAGL